ncbi:MAG: hypothetical protein Q9171_005939 [Xanthocarpia ochracea]
MRIQYSLDGEIEHHDPVEPSTTACPLLPGQQVNILEVPIQHEAKSEPYGCLRQTLESNIFTMDPKAKYIARKAPVNPKPMPVPSVSLSTDSSGSVPPVFERQRAYVGTSAPPPTAALQSPDDGPPQTSQGLCVSFPMSSSLIAKFFKLRGSRSAPDVGEKLLGQRRGPFKSFWRRSTEDEERRQCYRQMPTIPIERQTELPSARLPRNFPGSPSTHAQAASGAPWIAGHRATSRSTIKSYLQCAGHLDSEHDVPDNMTMQRSSPGSQQSDTSFCLTGAESYPEKDHSFKAPATAPTVAASGDGANKVWRRSQASLIRPEEFSGSKSGSSCASSLFVLPIQSNTLPAGTLGVEPTVAGPVAGIKQSVRPPSLLRDNRATLATFYNMNTTLAGQLSPHRLSQPESPSVRDFEEIWESESQPQYTSQSISSKGPPFLAEPIFDPELGSLQMRQLSSPEFQGYSLPDAEHASALTLIKLPSTVSMPARNRSPSSDNHCFVQSWNDGSGQRHLTALDELVDDLGYLGQIIV